MRLLPTKMGVGLVAAALVVSAIPANASSPPCFERETIPSARIHDLRVMLMVNALKCRNVSPGTLSEYRAFDNQRGDQLAVHGETLETAMIERFGPHDGRVAFDRYETSVSNYHSGFRASRERCGDTAAYIRLASRANDTELHTLSKLVTNRTIDSCLVPVAQNVAGAPDSFTPAGPVRPSYAAPAPREAVSTPAPRAPLRPAYAPEIVDGVPTYRAPGMAPNEESEPELAVIEIAASQPETSADEQPVGENEKLARAITALDAAAAALRDMQQSRGPTN